MEQVRRKWSFHFKALQAEVSPQNVGQFIANLK